MFLQQFCPTTGKMEWIEEDEDYDLRDEIGRSAFADMLHDDERNKKYYIATKEAVKKLKSSGKKLDMLDIGTGSGLLAMMAVESGADYATACEAFKPVANVAPNIIQANHLDDRIKVVAKRSTDLTVGQENCDMNSRATLLVTELWDTELIGEGALPTLRDACKRLLEPGFVCVPAAGTIYTQVFTSKQLWDMHQLDPTQISDHLNVQLPSRMTECLGTACGFDLHVDELNTDDIQLLSKPCPVLRFDFCQNSLKPNCPNIYSIPDCKDDEAKEAEYHAVTKATCSGLAHGVVMWWSLDMDLEGKITLETAPKWAHPDGDKCQWRDHWMQAVYYLKKPLYIEEGQDVKVYCCHDDYSLWFDVQQHYSAKVQVERPICTCGGHTSWSRHRYCMLNDTRRNSVINKALTKLVRSGCSNAVCVSDTSLLPLSAASVGFKKTIVTDTSISFTKLFQKILVENNIGDDRIELLDKSLDQIRQCDLPNNKVDAIIGEPFFSTSLFPWHSLHFWYATVQLRQLINSDVKVMPKGATLKGIGVEFKDLWKYHSPVNWVEGFDLTLFDQLIQSSKLTNNEQDDDTVLSCVALEPHHVWEYPCQPMTNMFTLMKFDFTNSLPDKKLKVESFTDITGSGAMHAVVLWMDFHLDDDLTITTGLEDHCIPSSFRNLNWVHHTKQGVYFFHEPINTVEHGYSLHHSAVFDPVQGEMNFSFRMKGVENGNTEV